METHPYRGCLSCPRGYKDYRVAELIARGLPVTLTIGALALLLALALGVPLGMAAALRHDQALDHFVMTVALAGIAIPGFVLAPVLALFFVVKLGWLPVAGWEQGSIRHMILPVVTLALPFVAYIARLTRGITKRVPGRPVGVEVTASRPAPMSLR